MDPDISRWLAEFQLRSSAPDSFVSDFLKILNLSKPDIKLKKTLLLRILESEIINASITETALDILEEMEAIDRNDAVPVLDSMRKAYCAVAVECTVKYLAATSDGIASTEYVAAVERIWRQRLLELGRRQSELFSFEITQWMQDIEDAVVDANVFERLAKLNTRYDAISAVRVYLEKVWETMGPCFLDTLAEMTLKSMEEELYRRVLLMEGVGLNGGHEGKELLEERAEGSVDGTHEPANGEKEKGTNQGPMENMSGDVDVTNLNTSRAIVLFQPKDTDHKKSSVHHSRVQVQCPNLMEENNTAHESPNLEQNSTAPESPDLMEHNSIAHESPNLMEKNRTSPNLMEKNRTTRSYERDNSKDNPIGVQLRRKKRKWSSEEEETLKIGVAKYVLALN